jgi:hypothetical protein
MAYIKLSATNFIVDPSVLNLIRMCLVASEMKLAFRRMNRPDLPIMRS